MKSTPTAVSVTLIITGTFLLALPAIHHMVMAAQEAYVLAHNDSRTFPRHELSGISELSSLFGGLLMVLFGARSAIAPGSASRRP